MPCIRIFSVLLSYYHMSDCFQTVNTSQSLGIHLDNACQQIAEYSKFIFTTQKGILPMKHTLTEKTMTPKNIILSDILGQAISFEDALEVIRSDTEAWQLFKSFPTDEQDNLLSFIQGNKGLKILSDKIFHHVMDPTLYPERLRSMLSAILEQEIISYTILPREGSQMVENGSLVIMDILVVLSNGTIINVEIQRVGYRFPGERSNCYIADLIMRQYNQVHAQRGKSFSYKDMKPVILIIIMESSSENFLAVAPKYIHRETVSYDSGAKVQNLSHTVYISLDTFHNFVQNINTELDAWLTFLGSDSPSDIVKLVNAYPEFIAYYKDLVAFRTQPKELMTMYSEALAIMDRNTELYMIDEMKATIDELSDTIDEMTGTIDEMTGTIDEMTGTIDKQAAEISKLKAELEAALAQNTNIQHIDE